MVTGGAFVILWLFAAPTQWRSSRESVVAALSECVRRDGLRWVEGVSSDWLARWGLVAPPACALAFSDMLILAFGCVLCVEDAAWRRGGSLEHESAGF